MCPERKQTRPRIFLKPNNIALCLSRTNVKHVYEGFVAERLCQLAADIKRYLIGRKLCASATDVGGECWPQTPKGRLCTLAANAKEKTSCGQRCQRIPVTSRDVSNCWHPTIWDETVTENVGLRSHFADR